ncbi:MAG: protein translocase subunit SecD [Planctomycetota bacterium]|nr:MAG: protein translocase subunit SecD [Planctomycetota bacterium]
MNDFSMGLSLLADATDKANAGASEGDVIAWRLLMMVALCVLPYVAGAILSRAMRLKEYSNRIGTVLFAITLGLSPFGYHIISDLMQQKERESDRITAQAALEEDPADAKLKERVQQLQDQIQERQKAGRFAGWIKAFRLGIDLAGGTNLIYQVETEKAQEEGKPIAQAMDQMVRTIGNRINPSGTEEVVVRRVGQDRIEIIIPGADPGVVAEKKDKMHRLGSLEFGIVANQEDHRREIAAARRLPDDQDKYLEDKLIIAVWRELAEKGEVPSSAATRPVIRKNRKGEDKSVTQVLVMQEPEEDTVTGEFLRRASTGMAEDTSACVNFSFDSEGAMRFFRLTDRNKPTTDGRKRQLAIILDGQVSSAPNLNGAIRDSGQITGNFSNEELKSLVEVLNAGALQLPINPTPISEFTISPLLGADVQRKGILALWVSSLAVFLFMAVYYRFCGVVANISLLLNLVLTLGVMVICNATFTLPGLAGMVLGLGMSVDANVLIYERMREEMERGSSLRMEIQNGFSKAFSAIWDSNVTTLIAAVVLYMIGTDQIKGFAVTLFIGICMSNFSALYFGHLVFDIAERKRWITKLNMMKVIGVPEFDFIGKLKTAVTFSVSFIVLGLALLLARGEQSLDIDFRGGSSVTFQFVKDQQIDDVRGKLEQTFGTEVSLERLVLSREAASGERGLQFRLRTPEQDIKMIRKGIASTFEDPNYELKRVTLEYTILSKGAATTSSPQLPDARINGGSGQDEVKTESSEKQDAKPEVAKKPASAGEPNEAEKPAAKNSEDKPAAKVEEKPVEEDKAGEKSEKKPATPATTKSVDDLTNSNEQPAGNLDNATKIDPFADANQTELVFSREISTSTAADYLLKELNDVNKNYSDANAIFRIVGTSGSGMMAAENEAKKYDKMRVAVRSTVSDDDLKQALTAMKITMAGTPMFEEVSNFAASVAEDMKYLAMLALLASGVATIVYLWFRFSKADFGIAAVVAVFHDVFFTMACLPLAYHLSKTPLGPILGLEDFKLNLSLIAAFLTIVGYSLNDTIVIFDRIREIRGRNPQLTLQMVNDSINQTLSRTILTAVIVFITVVILYFMGGEGIHGFAFCMLIGTMVGCYSTIYIASPLLLWMWNREQKQREAGRL